MADETKQHSVINGHDGAHSEVPMRKLSLNEKETDASSFFSVVSRPSKFSGKPTPPPRRVVLPLEPKNREFKTEDAIPLLSLNQPLSLTPSPSLNRPVQMNGSSLNIPNSNKLTPHKSAELTKLLDDAVQQMKSMHVSVDTENHNGDISPVASKSVTALLSETVSPPKNETLSVEKMAGNATDEADNAHVVTETSFAAVNPITRSVSSASGRDISVQAVKRSTSNSSQLSPWHVDSTNGVTSSETTTIRRTVMTTEL